MSVDGTIDDVDNDEKEQIFYSIFLSDTFIHGILLATVGYASRCFEGGGSKPPPFQL